MHRSRTWKLPSPGAVIATIALFAVLASTAWAATLPRNSVSTKSIKKNAVNSSKVKNNSLTGADIKETTLAKVPSAANADSVGGIPAGNLTTNDKLVTFNKQLPEGQEALLATFGPFSVTGRCITAVTGVSAQVAVSTTGSGGYAQVVDGNSVDYDFSAPETKVTTLNTVNIPYRYTKSFDLMDPASGLAVQGSVAEFLNYGTAETCRFAGSAVVERP